MKYNLDGLIDFFKCDMQVKKILNDAAPKSEYLYDAEKYSDILLKSIDYIEYYSDRMLNLFPILDSAYSKEFLNNLRFKVDSCNNDFYKLQEFYSKSFSDMSDELVSKVADDCVGYSLMYGTSLKCAKTVNEMLHIIHQSIINNENIYKKMPKVSNKENSSKYNVTLYGEGSDLATCIYNSFPYELDSGDVDIISFNNQFIIMIRDRGHALTIEIGKNADDDTYFVNYFIPKICNVYMVNNLRGVTKVNNNSKYTRGVFRVTKEELPSSLIELIQKVPMDEHMFMYGGCFYKEEARNSIEQNEYSQGMVRK